MYSAVGCFGKMLIVGGNGRKHFSFWISEEGEFLEVHPQAGYKNCAENYVMRKGKLFTIGMNMSGFREITCVHDSE